MSSIADSLGSAGTEQGTLKTLKVQIYPDRQQGKTIKSWFGTHRFVYNKFLAYTKNTKTDIKKFNFYTMRNKFVISNKGENKLIEEWELETPKDIRAGAIKDCITAHKGGFTKGDKFEVRFRTKKKKSYAIDIAKTAIKKVDGGFKVYPTFLKECVRVKKRTKKVLESLTITHDCKLFFDGLNYFLLIPIDKPELVVPEGISTGDIIALDPGVRTFQTGFSEKEVVEFKSRTELLEKYHASIARIQAKKNCHNKNKKIQRKYKRIKGVIDDLHWKTITYIKKNYTVCILPPFESQEMVGTVHSPKTKRTLLGLKHYQFKQRIKQKVPFVIDLGEHYTSKTCTSCAEQNHTLGSKKIFSCENCGLVIDRDINASRNIYLKFLALLT
jgi:transposase